MVIALIILLCFISKKTTDCNYYTTLQITYKLILITTFYTLHPYSITMKQDSTENYERTRLIHCLLVNVALLSFTITTVILFDQYFTFGPNQNLQLMSVNIDTWNKYFCVQL
jgi:hypothetical protein